METKYKIITNKQELKKLIQCCKQTGYASVDFETNAEPLYNKSFKPTILSVTFQPGFGCSIPLDHFETKKYTSKGWNWKKMLRKFGEEVIENPNVVKVAWNYKFDDQIFQKYNIYYRGVCLDGMLAKYLLNEEKPNDLKSMVRRYLPEYGDYEKQDKFDKIPWDKKEMEPLCHYGCQDTDYTLRLMLFFEKKLIDLGLYNTYRNLIMTASRVLTSVEKNGLYVDRAFNQELLDSYLPKIEAAKEAIYNLPKVKKFTKLYNQSKIEKYIAKLEGEIENLDPRVDKRKIQSREQKIASIRAGVFTTKKELELIRPVSLGSSVDLPQLMYSEEGFNFEVIKKNDSGKPSTDEETLTNLRLTVKKPDSPKAVFLDSLLELRGLEKMYKTYIEGWHEKTQDDDRLHGRFLIHGTTSGRLSSAEPNAQQIPKTSVDPNIKKQLVAPKGTLYIASDFSQAELRIMAHLSGDETYLNAFNSGQDPHLAIAATKYHVPYEEALKIYEDENHPDHKIWKVRRKQAKQIAFGLIYGIGAKLLAVKLSDPKSGIIVTPEEAQKEMDIFFGQHPKLKTFLKKQEKFLRKNGYLVSLFGRKRRLPQIYSSDRGEEAYALRLALNFPCLLPSSQALSKTKGWINYEDLKVGDEILAFNRDIGESEWQKVERVNVFDYDGDMIRLKTKHLDVLSTPDHRWVVTKPNKISKLDNTKVLTSEELYNSDKPYAIPIRAPHNNQVKARYSDAYVAFLGWYLTDGHLKNGNIVRICQSNTANPHKVDIIDSIMEELDVEFSRREKNQVIWEIRDPGFVYKLNRLVPERKLNMRLLTRLTNPQLSILLENMRLGDGWSVWATGDKTQGELLQALVVLCNNTSSMYELSHEGDLSYFKDKKPSKYGQEFVRATKTSYGVKFSNFRKSVNTKNTYNSENNLTKEKYVGKVWCPTVKSGAFFTRVIGEDKRYRTLITGNCQSAASDMCLFGSILIYYLMRQGKLPSTKSVCLVHDANYQITKPENINTWSIYEMWQIYRNPLTKPYFGFQIDDVTMDMDFVIGRSMAEELPFIPGYDYRKMLEPDFSVEEYMEEHKKYKHIPISEYKKRFNKQMKQYEEDFKRTHGMES
ncbi:MAG: DNA polymerase family A [Bacteriophage sp.]|nr:MAG: DNA polymerase family A [Bacteriophage sp.]